MVRVRQRPRAYHLEDAEKLYRMEHPSGVRVKLDDMFAAPRVAAELLATLPVDAEVRGLDTRSRELLPRRRHRKARDVHHPHADRGGGGLNIVSAQVWSYQEKRARYRDLRTLGAAPLVGDGDLHDPGRAVGLIGTLLGVVGGVLLHSTSRPSCAAIGAPPLAHPFLDKSVYTSAICRRTCRARRDHDRAGFALVLALAATIYPSWRAARVIPPTRLRYECAGPCPALSRLRKTYRGGRSMSRCCSASTSYRRGGERIAIVGQSGSARARSASAGGLERRRRRAKCSSRASRSPRCRRPSAPACATSALGFIYQFHHLRPNSRGARRRDARSPSVASPRTRARAQAATMLDRVELGHRLKHLPASCRRRTAAASRWRGRW